MRTLMGISRLPPMRRTVCSCKTRNNLACRVEEMSPISSRNNVPSQASSNKPSFPPLLAPVKVPSS